MSLSAVIESIEREMFDRATKDERLEKPRRRGCWRILRSLDLRIEVLSILRGCTF